MRMLLSFTLPLFFMSCSSSEEYPKIITKLGKQEQFNLAKIEAYKLNSCCECTCKGLVYLKNSQKDTVNIISLNIKLDTLITNSDTVFYHFSFFGENLSEDVEVFTHGKVFPECAYYYAVGYIGESTEPFKALINESAYSLYGIDIIQGSIDSSFQVCLTKKDIKINDWLRNYLKSKNPFSRTLHNPF